MFGISTQILWKIYIEDIDGDCRSESVPTLRLTDGHFLFTSGGGCKHLATVFKGSLYFKTITKNSCCMRCNMFKIFGPVYMYICLCS